jgi:serine/threonine protein kinase
LPQVIAKWLVDCENLRGFVGQRCNCSFLEKESRAMAVITSEGFLDTLEKSEVLSSSQLAAIREETRDTADSKDLARRLIKQGHLTRWQAAMLLQGRHGLRLGKYVLLEQIGSGELGHVFLAKHAQMDRRVALKVLSRRHSANPESIDQFLAEARKIGTLDHRNIIHLYDFENAGDRSFLVMEYVAGRDLERIVSEDGRLPPVKVAEYVRQAAAGLAHAHGKGVVHGDLKPANLLVEEQGTVKILDIGVARLSDAGNEPDEETGPGTSHYVAPEQASGGEIDHRADVYSLGCICYFLLTGKPPFADGPESPPAMVKICRKMMANKPDDRFQSAAAVEKALLKWLEQNQHAQPATASETPAKPAPARAVQAGNGEKPPAKSSAVPPASAAPPKRSSAATAPDEDSDFSLDIGPKRKPQTVEPDEVPFLLNAGDAKKTAPVVSGFSLDLGDKEKTKPAADSTFGIDVGKKDRPKTEAAPSFSIEADPKGKSKPVKESADKIEGASKRKKKAVAAPVVAEVEDEVDDDSADETADENSSESKAKNKPSRNRSKLWLIIGGASAAGVLAIAGVVLLVLFVFSGPKKTNVAEAPPVTETLDTAKAAANNSEFDPELDPEKQPSSTGRPVVPVTEEPENPAVPPADGTPDDNAPPPATGDKPPEDAGANPVPQPEPPDNKTPPAKPEPPKPAPPKPEPPKPAPPQNPFRDLAKSVDLPPLGGSGESQQASAEPASLSSVYVDASELFFVELEGGDKAYKSKQPFVLRAAPGSERDWEIFFTQAAAAELKVAQLAAKDNQLLFQWTAQAAAEPIANHLRNCVLSLRTGTAQERLSLRKPIEIGAVSVDFDKGVKAGFRVPWPPEPDTIRVDVAVEGKLPATRFDPSPTLEVGGETNIWFGDGTAQILFFKFECAAKRDIEVTATPFFKSPYEVKPVRFTKAKVNEMVGRLNFEQQSTTQEINAIGDPNKISDRRQQGFAIQAKSRAEQKLAAVQAASAEFQKVSTIYDDVNGTGQVHVRLYAVIGTTSIELATTGAAPAK